MDKRKNQELCIDFNLFMVSHVFKLLLRGCQLERSQLSLIWLTIGACTVLFFFSERKSQLNGSEIKSNWCLDDKTRSDNGKVMQFLCTSQRLAVHPNYFVLPSVMNIHCRISIPSVNKLFHFMSHTLKFPVKQCDACL